MGKEEIARYEQFLLFPQCFQKACFPEVSKGVIVWKWVKSIPNGKILGKSKLNAFAENKTSVRDGTQKLRYNLGMGRKYSGKRRNCSLSAFSPFPAMFSERFFLRVIKTCDHVGKIFTKKQNFILV